MKKIFISLCLAVSGFIFTDHVSAQPHPDEGYIGWIYSPLATPKNTRINAYTASVELTQSDINWYRNYTQTTYPDQQKAQIIGDATTAYNCHGYAWSYSSGGPAVCIGYQSSSDEDPYMYDGSYIQVCPTASPAKVSYASDDHSAITAQSATTLISKWRLGCLVKHAYNYCPYRAYDLKYYVLTPVFEGTETKCGSSPFSYTIASVPGGHYQWTSSSHFSLSANQNTVTVTPVHDGVGYVEVSITTDCGGSVTLRKVIKLGKPIITSQVPLMYWNGSSYNSVCNSQNYSTSMSVENAGNVTWSRIAANPTSTSWYQSGNNVVFYFFNVNQTAVFKINASNGCGYNEYSFGFKSITCGGGGGGCNTVYTVSPNPSGEKIRIVPNIPAPCLISNGSTSKEGYVSVYDQQGTLKKKIRYSYNSEAEIDVSDLREGIYLVQIYDGDSTQRKTIIVKH